MPSSSRLGSSGIIHAQIAAPTPIHAVVVRRWRTGSLIAWRTKGTIARLATPCVRRSVGRPPGELVGDLDGRIRLSAGALRRGGRLMARYAKLLGLVLVATTLALGCGEPDDTGSTPPAPAAVPTPAPAAVPTPAAVPVPSAEPEPAAQLEPLAEALAPGDASLGARVYAQNCATCHGATGDGDGPVSASLDPTPTRHSDGSKMNALDDAYLTRVIRDGGPAVGKSPLMAPWGGTLDDADIANAIAFIRSIADPPYPGTASK